MTAARIIQQLKILNFLKGGRNPFKTAGRLNGLNGLGVRTQMECGRLSKL
jgi:hypothetical protein